MGNQVPPGERPAVIATCPETRGQGCGESSLQGTNEMRGDHCAPACMGGPLQVQISYRSSGEGLLVISVTAVPTPLPVKSLLAGKPRSLERHCFMALNCFFPDEGDLCLCGLGKECPRLPTRHWRAGAPLTQSRSSSKLLPWLPGEGISRPQRGQGAAGAPPRLPPPPARLGAPKDAAPLGFAGGRVARLCQAALRRERARREKERDRGRSWGRGDARGRRLREAAGKREGAGRDRGAASAPLRRTAPGGAREGASGAGHWASGARARPARAGKGASGAGEGAGYLPGAATGAREGGRAVSSRARSGQPGPCGAPGTAATAEGHGEEGASQGGAPRPPPASSVTRRAGPRRPGGRPGWGWKERSRAPPNPAAGPDRGGGRPRERALSRAHHPGPPLRAEPQTLPPAASV